MCTCTGKHQAKKGGSEGPSWEQERGEGEGIAMEGSGQRTRPGTSQHLQDPVALLLPARCARQPLTDSLRGSAEAVVRLSSSTCNGILLPARCQGRDPG